MNWESDSACVVFRIQGEGLVTFHHLVTRAHRRDLENESWNKIPVSLRAHNMFHQLGTDHMANKYPAVREWLLRNGWEFNGRKWQHPESFAEPSPESQPQNIEPPADWPLQ